MADRIVIGAPEMAPSATTQASPIVSQGPDHSVTSAPAATDPISSIESPAGFSEKDMSKVNIHHSIEIGGNRMLIQNALHMGWVQRDANGNISLTEEGQSMNGAHQEQAQSAANESNRHTLTEDGDAQVVNSLSSRVGDVASADFVSQAASAMITGDADKMSKLCSDMKVQAGAADAEELECWVQQYVNRLAGSAIDLAESEHGVDGDEFGAWMRSALSPIEVSRLFLAAHYGDKTALKHVVGKFHNRSQAKVSL